MMNPQLRQLVACHRVAGHHGRDEPERIEDPQVVLRQAFFSVPRCRPAGRAVTAPGDSVNPVRFSQLLGEAVENVRGYSQSGKQDYWPSRSTPIERLQPDPV